MQLYIYTVNHLSYHTTTELAIAQQTRDVNLISVECLRRWANIEQTLG